VACELQIELLCLLRNGGSSGVELDFKVFEILLQYLESGESKGDGSF
jgi:hypothetical protein